MIFCKWGPAMASAVSANGQGAQAMLAADTHQPGQIDGAFTGGQGQALLHAEAVLLVDDHQRQVLELHVVLGDDAAFLRVAHYRVAQVQRMGVYGLDTRPASA